MGKLQLEPLAIDAVDSGRLQKLYEVWSALKRGREFPDRRDFLPEQVQFLLGQLSLVEVLPAPPGFRMRLVGTRLEECGRRGDQGKTLDELEPKAFGEIVGRIYRQTVESRRPVAYRITYPIRDALASFEQVVLPFSHGGEAVQQLLEGLDWPVGTEQNFRNITWSVPELKSA